MGGEGSETYRFIYDGVEYDVTEFIPKHPGGKEIIDDMKKQRKDITEHFKSLHSSDALKILKSCPIISKGEPSFDSKEYMRLEAKVEHLFNIRWDYEFALMGFFGGLFFVGCLSTNPVISILAFMVSQILAGWMGHSMGHTCVKNQKLAGKIFLATFGGFSMNWWSEKHNRHHMFTNSKLHDEDIQHDYDTKLLFPFLYLKWNYDSILQSIRQKDSIDMFCLGLRYFFIYLARANFYQYMIATLVGGMYSAFLLTGNHERETKFDDKITLSFIDHQLACCRNYFQVNFFWLLIMGGMQYQAEHHIFPQIPFYNLPEASRILKQQFKKMNKTVIMGPVI